MVMNCHASHDHRLYWMLQKEQKEKARAAGQKWRISFVIPHSESQFHSGRSPAEIWNPRISEICRRRGSNLLLGILIRSLYPYTTSGHAHSLFKPYMNHFHHTANCILPSHLSHYIILDTRYIHTALAWGLIWETAYAFLPRPSKRFSTMHLTSSTLLTLDHLNAVFHGLIIRVIKRFLYAHSMLDAVECEECTHVLW